MVNFPTTIDTLTNPVWTNAVATVDHSLQHRNVNDIVEALEAKVGVDSSAITDSLDYKVAQNTAKVKATWAEVDTGTDDAKFATAKAIADSKYVKSDETVTLTNKRITSRIKTFTSDATPDINSDDYDAVTITALAVAITDVNVTGTPTNFQKLLFRILDNGTARAIAWGDDFQAMGVALPTTTVISKVLTVGFIYDTVDSKWWCVATNNEA